MKRCPVCSNPTRVIQTCGHNRRRRCRECSYVFATREIIVDLSVFNAAAAVQLRAKKRHLRGHK